MFNDFLADVYVFTDHMAGDKAGLSPGYGAMLVAETTTKCLISAEACVDPGEGDAEGRVPEEVGKKAALALLEEIRRRERRKFNMLLITACRSLRTDCFLARC